MRSAADFGLQPGAQPVAADQAAAGEGEIEQAEHPPPGQRAGEVLQHVELPAA